MRDAALVRWIVETVGHVNQSSGLASDHLIAVPHAGRNQNLPRPQISHIQRVALAERGRAGAEIHQPYLKHAEGRCPAVSLLQMEMEGLDRPRIAQRR